MSRLRLTARRLRGARLVWPIMLVVLPVIVLSAVGLYSLREDHASIEQDARRHAAVLARDLARRVSEDASTRLATLFASACSSGMAGTGVAPAVTGEVPSIPLCGLVVDGQTRVPVDYPRAPSPPEWLTGLTVAEARAWKVFADIPARPDEAAVRRAASALAAAPAAVRANVEWALIRAEVSRGDAAVAAERLADFANRIGRIASESGTPLSDLALLLALSRLPAGRMPPSLVRELRTCVVAYPSFLTKALLDEASRIAGGADIAALNARWAASERALDLLRLVSLQPDRPAAEWVDDDGGWVAFVHPLLPSGTGGGARTAYHVTLVPAPAVERVFEAASARGDIPRYASARIRLGTRAWRVGAPAPAATASELASAEGQFDLPLVLPSDAVPAFAGELLRVAPQSIPVPQAAAGGAVRLRGVPGGHAFTIALDLTSPDSLYAAYRARLWLAVVLVLTATLAALAGLVATWRAFERQRALGDMQSNFVASVSHELRAPIAAVRLMVESLERGTIGSGERRQEYLRVMGEECRRLSSLVDNVLDFSRIDRGRRQYAFEEADLSALVVQTTEVMRPYAAQRQVALVCAVPAHAEGLLHPRIDREAMQQAVVNLVDNAIKHSPAGSEVVVGVENQGSPVARVSLFVEDRGPGIPPDEHEHVFEPFYRRGSELRRETRGIGIGLSIVKHIAEAHGGRVVVRSAPGAGSRFAIELDRAPQADVLRADRLGNGADT